MAESKSPSSETELKAERSSAFNAGEPAQINPLDPESGSKSRESVEDDPHAGLLLEHIQAGQELSEDVLDRYLSASDPEFVKAVAEIESDRALHAIDESSFDFEEWEEEKDRWIQRGGLSKKLAQASPLFPKSIVILRVLAFRLKKQYTAYRVRFVNFLFFARKEGVPRLIQSIVSAVRSFLHFILTPLRLFLDLTLKQKVLALASFILLVGSLSLLWISLVERRVLVTQSPLFLTDLSSLGQEISLSSEVDPTRSGKAVFFLDNPLVERYQFLIEKLVVNLRRSDMSSGLPMAALEVILESFSPDHLARIKARESFFREIIQSEVAKFTFEALETDQGKRELLENIQEALNRQLGDRTIASAHFKTIIVKP